MAGLNLFLIIFGCYLLAYLPGRTLLSLTHFSSVEKFAASFGLTFIIYYLLGFGLYVFQINSPQLPIIILIIISVGALLVLPKKPLTHKELFYLSLFLFAFMTIVAVQGLLPYYAGGNWYFDWFEHFKRMQFFANRLPLFTQFGPYILPARPPLFNVVAAFYQTVIGKDYWIFQIIASLLNLTAALPCFLLIKHLTGKNSRKVFLAPVLALLLLNPAFVIETTFTWTKYLAAGYLLLGFYFYLQYRVGKTWLYLLCACLFLSAAHLTHYSTAPYILGIGFDLGLRILFGKIKSYKYLGLSLGLFLLLTLTWYGWAVTRFGLYQTFLGNTAFSGLTKLSIGARFTKDIYNLGQTFLVYISPDYLRLISGQKYPIPILYDLTFGLYATTIPGQLTFTLSLAAVVYFLRHIWKFRSRLQKFRPVNFQVGYKKYLNHPRLPWIITFGFGLVFGLIALPGVELPGSAQIIYLPLSLVIWCFIFSQLWHNFTRFSGFIKVLLVSGLIFEAVLGIGLRIYASRYDINPEYLQNQRRADRQNLLLSVHTDDFMLKINEGLIFLADKYRALRGLFLLMIISSEFVGVVCLIRFLSRPANSPKSK